MLHPKLEQFVGHTFDGDSCEKWSSFRNLLLSTRHTSFSGIEIRSYCSERTVWCVFDQGLEIIEVGYRVHGVVSSTASYWHLIVSFGASTDRLEVLRALGKTHSKEKLFE